MKLVKGDWNAALLQEVEGFPDAAPHDDQVDCLSLIGRHLGNMSPGEVPKAAIPPEPSKIGISQDEHGVMFITQTLDELFENRGRINVGRRI